MTRTPGGNKIYYYLALSADLLFQSHLVYSQTPVANANNVLE